jgi:hypothetical protein
MSNQWQLIDAAEWTKNDVNLSAASCELEVKWNRSEVSN